MTEPVYKIVGAEDWAEAQARGRYDGSTADRRDGYIHLCRAAQLAETVRRHFAGQDGLVLVALDAGALGAALKWEPARGGDLFPHLYGPLPTKAALWAKAIRRDGEAHVLPDLAP